MRKLLILLAILLMGIAFTNPAAADEEKQPEMNPAEAEAMQKWKEYATPGDGHEILKSLAGSWNYTMNYWMSPGAEPHTESGTVESKWILDGRFLKMKVEGSSMGQPFEGMGIMGYNNLTNQYENVWIDNMGTGMMTATGTYDAGSKTITETGTYTDPSGEKEFRGVTTLKDADNYSYELFVPGPEGKEFRMLDLQYTRKK